MRPVADSMATHCAASGIVPRARQFDTTDCPTPIADASLPTPPAILIALSNALMDPIITPVIEAVNTPVIRACDAITSVETPRERLKRLRKAKGLTQPELAKRAGVSQGTIGNLETGLRGYGESIVSIAAALGVPPEYLQCEADADAERTEAAAPAPENSIGSDIRTVLRQLGLLLAPLDQADREQAEVLLRKLALNPEQAEQWGAKLEHLVNSPPAPAEATRPATERPTTAHQRLLSRLPQRLGAPFQADFPDGDRRKKGEGR